VLRHGRTAHTQPFREELALVTGAADRQAIDAPPRRPDEPMLARSQWQTIGLTGVIEAVVTLGVFAWALRERDLVEARTLAFSVLVFAELFRAFAARSEQRLFWEVGAFTNLRLLAVVVVSVFLQLALHHVPWAQALFEIGLIPLRDCVLGFALGLLPVTVLELKKLIHRTLASVRNRARHKTV
jgi:Ca2+-transporting ATPase